MPRVHQTRGTSAGIAKGCDLRHRLLSEASESDRALAELRWVCTWHLDFLPETNTVDSDTVSVNPKIEGVDYQIDDWGDLSAETLAAEFAAARLVIGTDSTYPLASCVGVLAPLASTRSGLDVLG